MRKPKEQLEAESRRDFVKWAKSVKGQEQLAEWVRKREEQEKGKQGK